MNFESSYRALTRIDSLRLSDSGPILKIKAGQNVVRARFGGDAAALGSIPWAA